MFEPKKIHVEMQEDGEYVIQWRTVKPGTPVTVYSGNSVSDIDFKTPLASTTAEKVAIRGLNNGFRRYFYLRAENGEGRLVGERRLLFEGTKNFRDLGGYKTCDGRRIKWGLLYRSGRLDELTGKDQDYFSRLNIGVICDFRREDEQVRCPSRLPKDNAIDVVDLPIAAGSTKRFLEQIETRQVSDDNMKGIMEEIYLDFAQNQAEPYGEMFRRLLEAENGGMLIHCTAGKDRTGFGSALILAALGVAPETVMADYLLTTRYFPIEDEMRVMAERYEIPLDFYMKIMRPVFEVHPQYLQAAFDEIEGKFRTMDNYLEEALGVTPEMREALRARLLED